MTCIIYTSNYSVNISCYTLKVSSLECLEVKGSVDEPLQLSLMSKLVSGGRSCSRVTANIPRSEFDANDVNRFLLVLPIQ